MSKIVVGNDELIGCLAENQSGGLQRASEEKIKEVGNLALKETVSAATIAGEEATTQLVAMRHPDYYADRYIQSPNFSRGGNSGKVLVIHTVQGSYGSCINWFQNKSAQVSAHYVVGYEGETTQMVSEYDRGWHAGYSNGYTIGIEHAGFVDDGYPPTEKCYHASAKLAAGIKRRHPGIRIVFSNANGVCGHVNLPNQTHKDPGREWDWKKYLALVEQYHSGGKPAPQKPPSKAAAWTNWAATTNWSNRHARAAVKALHDNGYRKTGATGKVKKAALDATDEKAISIVLGHTPWRDVPKAIRGKVEQAMEAKEPYKHPVWYADSDDEVLWRLAKVAKDQGLSWPKVKADYLKELGAGPNEPETPKSPMAKIVDDYFESKDYFSHIPYEPIGETIVEEVDRQGEKGLYYSTACALIEKETGGKNLFGCDWGDRWTNTPPYCRVAVTKDRVQKLIANVKNDGGQNGVGYTQLTTISYVYEAERLGGAHLAGPNMRVGFRVLLDHILSLGWPAGAAAYNAGAGNWRSVINTYGADMARFEREWAARLKNDEPSEGDELMKNVETVINYVSGLIKYNKGYRLWQAGESLQQPGFWGDDGPAPDYVTHTFCASIPNLGLRKIGKNPPRNGGIYNGGIVAYRKGYGSKMVPFKLSECRRGDIAFRDYVSPQIQGHIGICEGGADDQFLQSFRGAGEDGLNRTFTLRESHDGGYYRYRLPREAIWQ